MFRYTFNFQTQTTARLKLQRISLSHCYDLFELYSNEEIIQFTDNEPHLRVAQTRRMIRNFEKGFQRGEQIFLGISLLNSEKIIGVIGLSHLNARHQFGVIHFLLAKPFWNQGLMTEAVGAMLRYAFFELKLQRLEGQVYTGNVVGCRVMEKSHFQREGLLRKNFFIQRKFEDSYLYGIIWTDVLSISEPNGTKLPQ